MPAPFFLTARETFPFPSSTLKTIPVKNTLWETKPGVISGSLPSSANILFKESKSSLNLIFLIYKIEEVCTKIFL